VEARQRATGEDYSVNCDAVGAHNIGKGVYMVEFADAIENFQVGGRDAISEEEVVGK
jgi:hypothetical protein